MNPLAWYQIAVPAAACLALAVAAAVRPVPRLRAAVLGMAGMVGYAMLQDQVSARLCPEYFTVFHPPIPGLTDQTLLGIAWGFLGAWWGGLLAGYLAGVAATVGDRPPLAVRELVRPFGLLLLAVTAVTALTGYTVWDHARAFDVSLGPHPAGLVPPERRRGLLVVACYHLAAYAAGAVGSVLLCVWVAAERRRRAKRPDHLAGGVAPREVVRNG